MAERPERCEVCGEKMPVARSPRPRQTCSAACYQTKRRAEGAARRPTKCEVWQALVRARRGRVRLTCSDRCRQRKRRSDYMRYILPQQDQKAWRRAAREVRKIEKRVGSLDVPLPDYPYLTLAKRVQIRLQRGEPVPWCRVCKRPYIHDTWRSTPTCDGRCADLYRERQKALDEGLKRYAGRYDPRVDVRLRLGLPIKTCRHCGIPFPDYHPRRVYCSKRCTDKAWYALHPKRTCPECGTVYRGTRKTCSHRCRTRHWHRTATFCARCHHAVPAGREMRYEPSYNESNRADPQHRGKVIRFRRRCSARRSAGMRLRCRSKSCVECNAMFYPKSKHTAAAEICSRPCAKRHHTVLRSAQAERRPKEKTCEICGEKYQPDKFQWRGQRTCSEGCER
jgi:hypothetical protein